MSKIIIRIIVINMVLCSLTGCHSEKIPQKSNQTRVAFTKKSEEFATLKSWYDELRYDQRMQCQRGFYSGIDFTIKSTGPTMRFHSEELGTLQIKPQTAFYMFQTDDKIMSGEADE